MSGVGVGSPGAGVGAGVAPVAVSRWVMDDVVVGRSGELERLSAELGLARSGRPRVVTVEGAAGVGKTALVRHFLAGSGDVGIMDATAAEWESYLSFGVVAQLLSAVENGDGLVGSGRAGRVDDALVVGARLPDVVGGLAADRPLVVLVDDVQWSDTGSVHGLCFALRRLRFDAVLALLVGRDDGPGVPEAFRRRSSDRGSRLRLAGLDADELSQLATATGPVRLSRRAAGAMQPPPTTSTPSRA